MPIAEPAHDEIRRKAIEVLQRAEYQRALSDAESGGGDNLLLKAVRWLLDGIAALADALSFLGFLKYPVAILLCLALVGLIYRMVRALAGTARLPVRMERERRECGVRAAEPEEYEALAASARRDDRFVEAVRWLLWAALLRIEQAEKRKPRPGATNRELVRRYRSTPLQAPLQTLVETIDVHWYGDRPASADDFERCRTSYEELREVLTSRMAAAPAADSR